MWPKEMKVEACVAASLALDFSFSPLPFAFAFLLPSSSRSIAPSLPPSARSSTLQPGSLASRTTMASLTAAELQKVSPPLPHLSPTLLKKQRKKQPDALQLSLSVTLSKELPTLSLLSEKTPLSLPRPPPEKSLSSTRNPKTPSPPLPPLLLLNLPRLLALGGLETPPRLEWHLPSRSESPLRSRSWWERSLIEMAKCSLCRL